MMANTASASPKTIRKFVSVWSRRGVSKKFTAMMNETNKKKIITAAPRVASTSIDRLIVLPDFPVKAML